MIDCQYHLIIMKHEYDVLNFTIYLTLLFLLGMETEHQLNNFI